MRWPTRASSRTPLSAISAEFDLRRRRFDLRFGGVELAPALHHRRPRLIAVDVEIEPLLAEGFFGLADRGILAPSLIDRDGQLGDGRQLRQPDHLERGGLPLQHAPRQREVRIERALADLDGLAPATSAP